MGVPPNDYFGEIQRTEFMRLAAKAQKMTYTFDSSGNDTYTVYGSVRKTATYLFYVGFETGGEWEYHLIFRKDCRKMADDVEDALVKKYCLWAKKAGIENIKCIHSDRLRIGDVGLTRY